MATSRDHIIATTCDLLELQGYHATGLNQIIKESGAPKGSLYYYFPGGKEQLAVEAITHAGNIVLKRMRENLAFIDHPADSITTFIKNIAFHVEKSGFRAGGPITTIAMETASTNVALRVECQRIYEGWCAAIADKLSAGGIARDRADRLALIIIASIEGGVILCRTRQSPTPLENIADELGPLILGAMSA
jgi:TetR/AcrR family transcriptional repressor of lmrAB and yxaGH operons